jgi:hypothetical protein
VTRKSRSGPSGPNIPDAQRRRPPLRLTLSPDALAALEWLAERAGVSRSRYLETLIVVAAVRAGAPPPAGVDD